MLLVAALNTELRPPSRRRRDSNPRHTTKHTENCSGCHRASSPNMEHGVWLIIGSTTASTSFADSLKTVYVPHSPPPQNYPPYARMTKIVKKFRLGFEPRSPDYASGIIGQFILSKLSQYLECACRSPAAPQRGRNPDPRSHQGNFLIHRR